MKVLGAKIDFSVALLVHLLKIVVQKWHFTQGLKIENGECFFEKRPRDFCAMKFIYLQAAKVR